MTGVAPRVLHLGLGRFHRAHQAWYFDQLNRIQPDSPWLISSWSMRSPAEAEKLQSQEFKYKLHVLDEEFSEVREIRSIVETGWAIGDQGKLLKRFVSSELRWITLTVTEKAYHLLPNGKLNVSDPAIQKDLENPEAPNTAIGILALGLRRRLLQPKIPLTVLSCDNLASNGEKLRGALMDFMAHTDPPMLGLLEHWVDFPNSMVDRIVPAGSDAHTIQTESFSQWVIEDKLRGERPALEKVGVEFVPEARVYEERKLKVLNASHSYLAYSGLLRGHRYVHQAIRDPELRGAIQELHDEVFQVLKSFSRDDLQKYANAILKRFGNSKLPHELRQIAMDGSKKLLERILPSLRAARNSGTPHRILTHAVEDWTTFLWEGIHHRRWPIEDPIAKDFDRKPPADLNELRQRVSKMLEIESLWQPH